MTTKPIGRLEPVELRDIWLSEASDFTPWLAKHLNEMRRVFAPRVKELDADDWQPEPGDA